MRAKEERRTVFRFQHARGEWGRGGVGTSNSDSNERAEPGKGEMRAPVLVPPAELHVHTRSPMASQGRDQGYSNGKESGQGK